MTYRREATGNAATQIGYTDNNNLWIRGNSGGLAVYSNWYQIWSENNQVHPVVLTLTRWMASKVYGIRQVIT